MTLLERAFPARLGPRFRWLVASSWVANLGDGFALAAGPLLVASQTHNPTLVALAVLLQQLPWLLLGLLAGVVADRSDKVALGATVETARAAVLAVLAASIFTGWVDIWVVLAAMFTLGTAEVFSGTATSSLLPSLIGRDDLTLGNARLLTGTVTLNQLAGPPIGAALFAAGRASPFLAQAVLVGAGAVLIARIGRLPRRSVTGGSREQGPEDRPAPASPAQPAGLAQVWSEVAEGLRWVLRHAAVRTLVLTILIFNVTFGAAWAVLVLYAEERLHLGPLGYGVLTAASAVGGIAGTLGYGQLTRRVGLGNIMRAGLVIETLTHLSLALTASPEVAVAIMVVFGAHAFVWGSTSVTVRQRAVPDGLQGRVASVNSIGVYAGLVVGAALGGPIAARFGVTGPFWFAFGGSALFVVLIWGQLSHIAHDNPAKEGAPV